MYLLAPFILQKFKKILKADPEFWDVPFSGPKWPICPEQIFSGPFVLNNFYWVQTIIITIIYLLVLFIVQNLK